MALILTSMAQKGLEKSDLGEGKMILPGSAQRGIGSGIDSGKGVEIVGEMGLVVIAAAERQFRPSYIGAAVQSAHGDLEAANPAPHFRGEADMFSKHLGESALTESDSPGAIGDAKVSFPK